MSAVKGWCPGAHRPMQTGDGLLVRIRPHGGALRSDAAAVIADGAARFGNGLIELTSRANVQIRGVSEATFAPLLDMLQQWDLIDADADAERRRNVIASPLAGHDPHAKLDIRPITAALEQALAIDNSLADLPAKFCFVVEDGGSFDLSDVHADVRFIAYPTATGVEFFVSVPDGGGTEQIIHPCTPEAVPAVARQIARAFVDLRAKLVAPGEYAPMQPDSLFPRRMHDLIRQIGLPRLVEVLGAASSPPLSPHRPAAYRSGADCLGLQADARFTGVATPFGRWTAEAFRGLAKAAETLASGELRLTPWRTVLVPGVPANHAAELNRALGAIGGILDAADPRLAVVACPGTPYCLSASTPTQTDALTLAPLARRLAPTGLTLHVSGCTKGCAQRAGTPVTLIGNNGRYDLVFDGNAQDGPQFRKLSLDDAARVLCERAETMNESASL